MVFPALKPINVVVAVITVIEALRAYDIVAALSEPRGTEVMGTLVTNTLMGEGGGRVGIGSAYGMVLFLLCIGFIIWYVINNFRESGVVSAATHGRSQPAQPHRRSQACLAHCSSPSSGCCRWSTALSRRSASSRPTR